MVWAMEAPNFRDQEKYQKNARSKPKRQQKKK
jgi:hypothetical protein